MSTEERPIWTEHDSGILVPFGRDGQVREGHTDSFAAIKQMAIRVRELYAEKGISLNPVSSLCELMNEVSRISDSWLSNNTKSLPPDAIFKLCHGYRVCSAIDAISNEPAISEHLSKLASGSLNLLARSQSGAKDFLWEVELFGVFKGKNLFPKFEEPDITILADGRRVSVACKKIYSEKRLQASLSTAVAQIQKSKRHGLVAINLDDLYPENAILQGASSDAILDTLSSFNRDFIARHEGRFRKYMEASRIVACLVSSSIVSDSKNGSPRINNHRQDSLWVIPKNGSDRQAIANSLYSKLIRDSSD